MADERKEYINRMKKARGYVGEMHKILVAEDFDFARGYNGLAEIAYTNPRRLDRKTKEFIHIGMACARLAPLMNIKTHMEQALKAGATKEELLEVLELIAFPCGGMSFGLGFEALQQLVPMQKIEPDP